MKVLIAFMLVFILVSSSPAQKRRCEERWKARLYEELNHKRACEPDCVFSLAFTRIPEGEEYNRMVGRLRANELLNDQLQFVLYSNSVYHSNEIIKDNMARIVEDYSQYIISHSLNLVNPETMELEYSYIDPKVCGEYTLHGVIAQLNKTVFRKSASFIFSSNSEFEASDLLKTSNEIVELYELFKKNY